MKYFFNKLMFLLLAALVLAACGGSTLAAPTPAADVPGNDASPEPSAKLLIGTDATFPPFESVDLSKRQIVGFDVDLMNAIAAKAGLQIEIVGTRYGLLLDAIARCQLVAGISAIPITDDLKQEMLFSDPYYAHGQVVVVKKGNITIKGRDTLAGMTVGAQINTNSVNEIQQIPEAQLASYTTAEFAFRDLIAGLIDAVVADKLTRSHLRRCKTE